MFEFMMEIKQCQICNKSEADDEVRIILSKKFAKTSLVKVVSIPCCHKCKVLLSSLEKRVKRTRWMCFLVSLVLLSVAAVICVKYGVLESLSTWLGVSAVASFFIAHGVFALFFRGRYERIERQECQDAGMKYIGDYPEVQKFLIQRYRIQHKF